MDNQQNKFLAVTYKLYTGNGGEEMLIEEATQERPFVFLSGFGVALDAFEQQILATPENESFDFVIKKADAYGETDPERIVKLPKDTFIVNGKFDSEHVKKGEQIPLQNEEGQRFYGKVLEIADDHVKIDLNHPLAGKDLNFKGHVVENREATNDEIQSLLNHMSGGGCGCGCHDCGDDCGDGCGDGCGHCH